MNACVASSAYLGVATGFRMFNREIACGVNDQVAGCIGIGQLDITRSHCGDFDIGARIGCADIFDIDKAIVCSYGCFIATADVLSGYLRRGFDA